MIQERVLVVAIPTRGRRCRSFRPCRQHDVPLVDGARAPAHKRRALVRQVLLIPFPSGDVPVVRPLPTSMDGASRVAAPLRRLPLAGLLEDPPTGGRR